MAMITKDMPLMELLQNYPRSREVLERHGMSCLGCMGSELETIERGARMHGINADQLVRELNDVLPNQGS